MSGHLYAIGNNAYGKLGISVSKNGESPEVAYSTPKLVDALLGSQVFKVSCGWNHTAAVTRDGTCYTWGQGEFG